MNQHQAQSPESIVELFTIPQVPKPPKGDLSHWEVWDEDDFDWVKDWKEGEPPNFPIVLRKFRRMFHRKFQRIDRAMSDALEALDPEMKTLLYEGDEKALWEWLRTNETLGIREQVRRALWIFMIFQMRKPDSMERLQERLLGRLWVYAQFLKTMITKEVNL